MKKFCRTCVYLLAWLLAFLPSFSSAARTSFKQPDWDMRKSMDVEDPTIYEGGEKEYMKAIPQWIAQKTNRFEWILQFPERPDYTTSLWYALSLIQISINWILGILATISLTYMLYCWFLVFSSWADDKNASKGRKWISTAAIALAWIGLSWLVVSAMIWFISNVSQVN